MAVADGERDIETARQKLCILPNFIPIQAWKRIKKLNKHFNALPEQFIDFLAANDFKGVLALVEIENLFCLKNKR